MEDYPGTRTNAGIKWHYCFGLMASKMNWFQLTPTSTHDSTCFPALDIIKGALFIFDLGYWDYGLFLKIKNAGAFFLSRIKTNSSITISSIISGISKKHLGKKISKLSFKKRSGLIVELIGEIIIEKLSHNFRVIGFWNPNEKKYHWY